MTKRDDVADAMSKSDSASDRAAGKAIKDAAKDGGVQYVQVNQPLDKNGDLKPVKASEFSDRPTET
jgi:hypothetical protein